MNGYQCAANIKRFYNHKQLFGFNEEKHFCPYLVACSAYVTDEIEEKARDAGFDIILQSPLQMNVLEETIISSIFEQIKYEIEHQINNMNNDIMRNVS